MTDLLGMAALALDEDVLAGFGLLSPAEQAEYLELIEQALEGLWVLTPKQQLAEELWGKVDWLLYGGSAAGGKSEFACHHANRLSTEIEGHSTLLIRQSIPELRRSLILRLLARGRQFRLPMRLRKVDGQTGFHYENGSLIECGYLATDEHVGNYLCFHPSHEILTETGWKSVADVKMWEPVATVDPATNEMWYEPVTAVHEYDYDGEMIEVEQKNGISMCVTPNHTVWCRTPDKPEPRPFRADSMPAVARIPRTTRAGRQRMPHDFVFASDGNNGRTITVDPKTWAEFLGWFASEGSTDVGRWAVRIHQQKAEGCAQIENLLDRMEVNWWYSSGTYSFSSKAMCEYLREHVGTLSGNKRLPSHLVRWFPAELLDIFLDAYTEGDGTKYRDDTYRIIVTSSPKMADDLSHVAVKAGWRVTSAEQPKQAFNGYRGEGPMYRIYLSRAKSGEGQVRPDAVKRVPYQGKVHCVTVGPHNTLVTRRNGRVHWTGNSAEYDAIIIDEATQLMPDHIVALSARLRTTKEKAKRGSRPHLGLFTNPGDVSHAFLYNLFVVPTDYGNEVVVFNVANGIERAFPVRSYRAPVPVREATFDEIDDILIPWAQQLEVECDPETELAVAFVPSKATDNPHIDRSYLKFLNALPDRRRRQLRDGDWDTFEGQFFEEWARDSHVVPAFDIPEHWPRARAADYGSAAPWACYWGAWEPETGNCYVYRERYGAGLSPQQQGRAAKDASVIVRQDGSSVKETYFASVGDPSVFSNSRGQGKSIADLWREAGFTVSRAKNARVAGWANMRQYLWDHEKDNGDDLPAGGPRLFVFDTCPDLIRTMPLQQRDKDNPEDLNTKLEDHACVAPDTLVATRRGEVPISTVVSGDEVATRAGWRRVEWAGVTGVRPLVRLSLPDGGWLDCTEDHPVWTENRGWIAAGSVAHCDTLHALWTPLSSPKATTSIMSMGTGPTIGSPISNSWTAQITSAFTPPSARLLGLLPLNARFRVSSLETPDSPPSSEQKPPGSGGSPRSAIISSSARRAGAKCSRRFRHGPSSVGSTAARPQCELASVPLGYSSPVWNLLVEGEHEFYANGYLVHNCDAIRYLLALRPLQAGPSTRAPKTGQSLDQRFTFRLRQFDKKHRNRRQGWT